ncbi:MAG: hypothetical protein J6D52_06750 [Clostridia bacterium]|nr:hypothetical protein [Clostridia bacterium]
MSEFIIVYGEAENGVQKKAIENLSEFLLDYTYEYPVCVKYSENLKLNRKRCIYIGTKQNNQYINKNSAARLSKCEEYCIKVQNDTVIIEGYDDNGVLYGVIDFYNKYLLKMEYAHNDSLVYPRPLQKPFPDFLLQSAPAIKNRGIWTWGHVIYNYKGFIDNMVKLKMNLLIMWNDAVPFNAKDIIDYAHSCGIKIIFGYPWCWDTDCNKFDLKTIMSKSPEIFEAFEKQYSGLDIDGIYFQSFTELRTEKIGGILIADAVTRFVNATAELFFNKYPNLELQFGLHATSVKEKTEYLKKVNPKIKIVWEDLGAFPFSYLPDDTEYFEKATELVGEISTLRGKEDRFGVVSKGFTKLDWGAFRHIEGEVNLGVSSKFMRKDRADRKRKCWKYLQAYWLTNADKALEMVKTLYDAKNGNLDVTALVEDGMFEESIMFIVALYFEMLCDKDKDLKEMINEVALRGYVDFA